MGGFHVLNGELLLWGPVPIGTSGRFNIRKDQMVMSSHLGKDTKAGY